MACYMYIKKKNISLAGWITVYSSDELMLHMCPPVGNQIHKIAASYYILRSRDNLVGIATG
jgi:hypothetical protein